MSEVKKKVKFADKIKIWIRYVTHDIWVMEEHEYSSDTTSWLARQFKVILYAIRGIQKHDVFIRSAALTFFTIMSIVPIFAMAFGIAKGFGLDARLSEFLYTKLAGYGQLLDNLLIFADNMLQRARGGVIAAVGVLVLFWSVLKVFDNIEKAFNSIWEVHKPRSIGRKASDYLAVMIIAPILLVLAASTGIYMKTSLSLFAPNFLVQVLFYTWSLVMIWLLFSFVYKVIPNTNVRTKTAFTGGIIAGTAFMIFQSVYFTIQSSLININAIYGTFAAIPLFLIWLQISWQILLFGAELTFANQNISRYEIEKVTGNINYNYRKKIYILVMYHFATNYIQGKGPLSSERISDSTGLSLRVIRDTVYNLLNAGLIVPVITDGDKKTHFYLPAQDVTDMRIFDVIKTVENTGGINEVLKSNRELKEISRVADMMENTAISSKNNIKLVDLDLKPLK